MKRQVWVESLCAEAKTGRGLRRFRWQCEQVNGEALLIATGQETCSGCSVTGGGVVGSSQAA
ncbi:MAG: hypothetical protein U0075_13685 [Thermomicrobiales bacterium]